MQASSIRAPLETCCAYAGVTPRAGQRRREYGRRDREQRGGDDSAPVSIHEQLLERYDRVGCEAELRGSGQIQLAGEKERVARAWSLESRRPEDCSRRSSISRSDPPSLGTEEPAQAIAQAKREVRDSIPKPRDWGAARRSSGARARRNPPLRPISPCSRPIAPGRDGVASWGTIGNASKGANSA